MSRTTLLQERRMQTFQDVLGHWQAQRLSALEAAELLGMSERSFRRAQRRKCGPGGALSLPRRPRLRRHGPGAGRHAQRHGDLRARPRHGDHRAHARQGALRLPAGGRPRPRGAHDRSALAQMVAMGRVRLLRQHETLPHHLLRLLRSGRLQAGFARHGAGSRRRAQAAQLVPVRRSSRTAARPA